MARDPAAVPAGGPRLTHLAETLAGLRGWSRHGAAALCGALAAAGLPPVHLVPFLLPAFAGLVWLLDGASRRREAALLGWSFGFGHMVTGLYWVGAAFLVEPGTYALATPFAVAGLAAGLAIFPALVALGTYWSGLRGPARVLVFAGLWLVAEWLRSWVFTGFPWNLIGSVWSFSPGMLQLAAYTGVWGLSLMTVLAAAAPAALAEPGRNRAMGTPHPARRFVVALLLFPALAWIGGTLRLQAAPEMASHRVEGVRLRLVQPRIEQSLKWRAELRMAHIEQLMKLTVGEGFPEITHVIWPETAVSFLLSGDKELRRAIARTIPPGGLLITGAPRAEQKPGERRFWNSLHALDARGRIVATYDKHHLVPFGEYVPLRGILDVLDLAKLTAGRTDYTSGPGPVTLALPGLPPFSPLICYEVIFPGRVVGPGPRPSWLLNITNDAWFGSTAGPYQHLASARIRAVEEGLPLVRVANSGISAVFDGYGRQVGQLELNARGVLDTPLPLPAVGTTLYVGYGDRILLGMVLALALFAWRLRRFR